MWVLVMMCEDIRCAALPDRETSSIFDCTLRTDWFKKRAHTEKLDSMFVHGSKLSDLNLDASSLATGTMCYFTMVGHEAI